MNCVVCGKFIDDAEVIESALCEKCEKKETFTNKEIRQVIYSMGELAMSGDYINEKIDNIEKALREIIEALSDNNIAYRRTPKYEE